MGDESPKKPREQGGGERTRKLVWSNGAAERADSGLSCWKGVELKGLRNVRNERKKSHNKSTAAEKARSSERRSRREGGVENACRNFK